MHIPTNQLLQKRIYFANMSFIYKFNKRCMVDVFEWCQDGSIIVQISCFLKSP